MRRKIYRYGEEPENINDLYPGDIIEKDYEIGKFGEDIIELPVGIYVLVEEVRYLENDFTYRKILDVSERNTEPDQDKMSKLFKEIGKALDFGSRHLLKELLDMHFIRNDQVNCLLDLIDQGKDEIEKALFKEVLDYIVNS